MNRFLNIGMGVLAFLAVAALLATAVMALTADRGGEVSQDVGDPATPAPAATATLVRNAYIAEVPDSEDIPVLTKDQINAVKNVLNSDARLAEVLSGESFTVTNMGPWTNSGDDLLGALVAIELHNPVSYTGSLPAAGFLEDDEGYIAGEVSARADGIESLEMLVDLNKRIVVDIYIAKATGEVHIDYGKPQRLIAP